MRNRCLKPDFFKSEKVATLSRDARLLFAGLWTMSDSWGVLEDRPRRIRVEIFPYDDLVADQVVAWVDEIVAAGMAVRYQAAGVPYLWMPGLRRHQVGSMPQEERKKPPRLPFPRGITQAQVESGKATISDIESEEEPPTNLRGPRVAPQQATVAVPVVRSPTVSTVTEIEAGGARATDHRGASEVPQRGSGDMGIRGVGDMGVQGGRPAHHLQADAIDPESRWVFERREPWARVLDPVVGSKLSKTTWPRWKRLVDRWGAHAVAAAAEALPPEARWDDRVEGHLIEHAPPPPEPEDAELDAVRALIGEHGWQACLAVVGFGNVRSAEVLVIALEGNRPACRKLIAHYGGGAAAGAGAA